MTTATITTISQRYNPPPPTNFQLFWCQKFVCRFLSTYLESSHLTRSNYVIESGLCFIFSEINKKGTKSSGILTSTLKSSGPDRPELVSGAMYFTYLPGKASAVCLLDHTDNIFNRT
jgi:hypothetical protein